MARAADLFGLAAGRPVIDRTGLVGTWQFVLTFMPPSRGPSGTAEEEAAGGASDPDVPSFFTAIQEQLGLKLEPTNAPIDVMVTSGPAGEYEVEGVRVVRVPIGRPDGTGHDPRGLAAVLAGLT